MVSGSTANTSVPRWISGSLFIRKAPSPKHQDPEKVQAPSSKIQRISKIQDPMRVIGAWDLVLLWILDLGSWSFFSWVPKILTGQFLPCPAFRGIEARLAFLTL